MYVCTNECMDSTMPTLPIQYQSNRSFQASTIIISRHPAIAINRSVNCNQTGSTDEQLALFRHQRVTIPMRQQNIYHQLGPQDRKTNYFAPVPSYNHQKDWQAYRVDVFVLKLRCQCTFCWNTHGERIIGHWRVHNETAGQIIIMCSLEAIVENSRSAERG